MNQHRIRPRSPVYVAIVLLITAFSLYCVGFYPSLNGGILGNILMWPATFLAGIAGLCAIVGGISGFHRKRLAVSVISVGLLLTVGSATLAGALIRDYFAFPMHTLSSGSTPSSYNATRIECHFGPIICTIFDPHNAIWVCEGAAPTSVSVLSGVRVVRIVDQASTLRSLRDSIYLGPDGIDNGGWMGAESDLIPCFFSVDEWGMIQATNQETEQASASAGG